VLEFMPGGDLSKILRDEVYLEEEHAKFYLAEIVLAL
jgi:serine/threonine protein kinase